MKELESIRANLLELNRDILNNINERRELIKKIADIKSVGFDADREIKVFKTLKNELAALTPHECFVFSFLMESQANQYMEDYPRWSSGVHLVRGPINFTEKTNPLLLKFFQPEVFATLPLKSEFEYLRQMS